MNGNNGKHDDPFDPVMQQVSHRMPSCMLQSMNQSSNQHFLLLTPQNQIKISKDNNMNVKLIPYSLLEKE